MELIGYGIKGDEYLLIYKKLRKSWRNLIVNLSAIHSGVTIDDVEGTFDYYVVQNNDGEMMNLYLQQQIRLVTGN